MRNAMNMKVQIRKQKTLPQKTHRKITRKSLPRIQLIDIHYGYTIYSEENMIATVSRWGNSLGIRIPADIANSSGINDGDKVDITRRPDGSIVIQKKKKDKTDLKAFGMLHNYANPELIPLEKNAFGLAMEEKYGKVEKDVY